MGLHLLLTVTILKDLAPREHIPEVGLDRADSSGFFHTLLRSLSQVHLSKPFVLMFLFDNLLNCFYAFKLVTRFARGLQS